MFAMYYGNLIHFKYIFMHSALEYLNWLPILLITSWWDFRFKLYQNMFLFFPYVNFALKLPFLFYLMLSRIIQTFFFSNYGWLTNDKVFILHWWLNFLLFLLWCKNKTEAGDTRRRFFLNSKSFSSFYAMCCV